MNALSPADQSKLLPLLHRCPEEARLPNQRNRDASSVDQVHNQKRSNVRALCIFLLIEISPELLPGLPALEVLSPNDTRPLRP